MLNEPVHERGLVSQLYMNNYEAHVMNKFNKSNTKRIDYEEKNKLSNKPAYETKYGNKVFKL